MDMVEQSGPKNAGEKPSSQKQTNDKGKQIKQYVDLFDEGKAYSTASTSNGFANTPSTQCTGSITNDHI